MPLQISRGLFEIGFVSALALGYSVAVVGLAPIASESVTDRIASLRSTVSLTTESESRSPNFNDNLQSELKFNQETAKNHDRLTSDLYDRSDIDTSIKAQKPDISEFDRAESESKITLAQLPNRGENRQDIPVPNRILPTPTPLPALTPPAPQPPPEQLLQPTALTQPEELLNLPDPIEVYRLEVVGSNVFSKAELDTVLKDFVGRPLTFSELLQARSAVSQLYISKGYITSGALIPPPTLAGGNIIEPPFDVLDIEASNPTYELTYPQPLVQTPSTDIAIGVGAGRRESDTFLGTNRSAVDETRQFRDLKIGQSEVES
jgi:POTRA domain, ShlB-type